MEFQTLYTLFLLAFILFPFVWYDGRPCEHGALKRRWCGECRKKKNRGPTVVDHFGRPSE